jgi:NAD(P)-dependent dehydrogenase (short-subunit alcohol dehydrogenase family)
MRFVVTGANRGLGLEFVKQLVARGDSVEAGARSPDEAPALKALAAAHPGKVRVHTCDVESDASVRAFASALDGEAVDVVLNNAGVYGKMQSLEELDLDDVTRTFNINSLGPIRVTRALLPHLRRGGSRKVAHVASVMGSIVENQTGGAYGYRMSKAALNMAARSMAIDLRPEGFLCVALHPGWVKTDMGGPEAPIEVQESVAGMISVIDGLTLEQSGGFIDFQRNSIGF